MFLKSYEIYKRKFTYAVQNLSLVTLFYFSLKHMPLYANLICGYGLSDIHIPDRLSQAR